MRHSLAYGFYATLWILLAALPVLGQSSPGGSSGSGSSQPSTPSPNTRTTRPTPRPAEPYRGPTFVTGRVLSELARPLSEPVSVELNCGLRSLQVIHTDLSGYFTFNLGGGAQSNIDFSASNEGSQMLSPNMQGLPTRYGNPLAGCELRVSVAGYRPRSFPLPHTSDFGRLDVGNLILERIGTMKGSAVSVTSLMVPKEAGKEFEKAVKELQKNKPDAAMPHLEKAVQIYDRYAAAWNEIGRIQLRRNEREKAVAAFEKSTGADPEYLPPLVNLATLYIQNREWEKGVETAGKVLELNPDLGFASFLQAVGNFNLNRLEEAERSAQTAEKNPHDDNPQVHALLAQIYMTKQDYVQAASHIRTYLQESPNGSFAEQLKKDLAEIEEWLGQVEPMATDDAKPGS